MHFHDRTSYLAAIAAWKAAYAAHSIKLRQLKQAFKQAQRTNQLSDAERLRSDIAEAKAAARNMLQERSQAKKEAQAQWLAQRSAAAT